jgi:hypothetical protein
MLLAVMPVWAGFAALFFSIWPWRIAAGHLVALGLLGSILGDVCMHGFHKIPFTCSYQPGKGNIQFAFWGFLALIPFTWMAADEEWEILHRPESCAILVMALFVVAVASRWRTTRAAKSADGMQFEEVEEGEIQSLGLA